MNEVVAGQERESGRTSGSGTQNRTAAPRAAAKAMTRTRRRSLVLDRGQSPAQLPHALLRLVLRQDQVWAEADGIGAGGETHHAVLEAGGERLVARRFIREVEGD